MPLKTKGRIWWLVSLLGVVVMLGAALTSSATADTPPTYEGALSFPDIQGSEGPEDFSWTVDLSPGQMLVQIDDQHAAVKYESGVTAFQIEAEPASDAIGASVPTTIAVSEGDVVTLTVHHLAGNQAAGGAPFHYPITDGAGREGGLQTTIIEGPPDEQQQHHAPNVTQPDQAPARCRVPNLKGRNVKGSQQALRTANCSLGKVHHQKGKGTPGAVVRQGWAPGTELALGSHVWVTLGSR